MLALVVDGVRRSGQSLPDPLPHLRSATLARHLAALEDLAVLREVAGRAEVAWALLKGPVLSTVVYERRLVRDYTDLDVLVSGSRIGSMVESLVAAGASLLPTDWAHITSARTAEIGIRLPHGTVLDLHWSLVNLGHRRADFVLDTDDLLSRRVERDVDGHVAPTLDDLDLVLHVLLHACLSGGTSLRWLVDVQQCTRWLGAGPDTLAERAARLGLTAPARAVLEATAAHLDPEVSRWAETMGRATPWTRALAGMSRRLPPSAPSVSARSARTWYAATRPSTARSVAAVGRHAVRTVRYARSGWPEPVPVPAGIDDDGFRGWLALTEQPRQPFRRG